MKADSDELQLRSINKNSCLGVSFRMPPTVKLCSGASLASCLQVNSGPSAGWGSGAHCWPCCTAAVGNQAPLLPLGQLPRWQPNPASLCDLSGSVGPVPGFIPYCMSTKLMWGAGGAASLSGLHSVALRHPSRRRRVDSGTEGGAYHGPSRLVDGEGGVGGAWGREVPRTPSPAASPAHL